jgi:hypothetical protein
MAQCQTLSISEQLAAGIRRLDVRCRQQKNTYEIYHTVYQNLTFDSVYTDCIQFLQAHPGECILMDISSASTGGDPIDPIGTYEDVFDRYQQMHPAVWYLGDAIPSLDEVRGKIVLLRGFDAVRSPKGIDKTGGPDNTTYDLSRTSTVPRQTTYVLHCQGNYNVPTIFDINSHAQTVIDFLAQAASSGDDNWFFNGAEGSSGGAYPRAVALGVSGTTSGTNAQIADKLRSYGVDPFVRFGSVNMDFPDTGLIQQLVEKNGYSCVCFYDLLSTADRVCSFDYESSGQADHLVCYRPGTGAVFVLKNNYGVFTPVYRQGDPGNGIGDFDLKNSVDLLFAFDYKSTGKADHLVCYRPGTGRISILKNSGGQFVVVYTSTNGIGGYDLRNSADRMFAIDFDRDGKADHLACYRPGAGVFYILENSFGQWGAVYTSGNGIGGFDLRGGDQVFAFDYEHSGKLDYLVCYRPGSGAIFILKNNNGQFTAVYAQGDPGSGIGGFDLKNTADHVFAFDYDSTGKADHLVCYRPGAGIISLLKNNNGQFS